MNDGTSLGERRRPMVDDDAPFIDGHRVTRASHATKRYVWLHDQAIGY